jgi:hypothetical protein
MESDPIKRAGCPPCVVVIIGNRAIASAKAVIAEVEAAIEIAKLQTNLREGDYAALGSSLTDAAAAMDDCVQSIGTMNDNLAGV